MASFDDLPTQVNLEAISRASPDFTPVLIDGLPLDQQDTWLIPAVLDARKGPKGEGQDPGAKHYVQYIRTLVKSSGIYALSSLASPLVALVLAPFLTHTLSHSDYGALAVLNTAIALTAGITQLNLGSAFFRAYTYDYESQSDRSAVLSTLIVLLSLTSTPVAIAMIIAAPWVSILLFNSPSFSNSVSMAGLVILLQNLTVPGFSWLRAEGRAAYYSSLSITNLLIGLSANIVLVGVLHMGIPGSLLATGSGYAAVVVSTLPLLLSRAGLRPRLDVTRNLLSFGIPLVCSFVANWFLQLSDRYLLSRFTSLAETASYAVAYSLGSVLIVVIITPFQLAWPAAMFAIAKRDDAAQVFRLVFRWYTIVLLFAAFALSLVALAVLHILFPPAYYSTAPVIPIIALSITFYGAYAMFTVGVSVRRKTWLAVTFTGLAALVNIGLNLILIPLGGSMGAAISTLVAYIVLALISYVVNQRIYPVPFEIHIFIIVMLIGIVLYSGADILAQTQDIYLAWAIRICSLGLYGGCLAFMGKLPTPGLKKKYPQSLEGSQL